jgi:hypothetical protein
VIESNAVFFEGPSFFLRPDGTGQGGLARPKPRSGLGQFHGLYRPWAALGADCWSVAQPAARYDSPTWGGFRFETSYGKNQLTPTSGVIGSFGELDTSDDDF